MSSGLQGRANPTYIAFLKAVSNARQVSVNSGEFELTIGGTVGSVRVKHAKNNSVNQIHLKRREPLVVRWKRGSNWSWYVVPFHWLLEQAISRDQKPQHGTNSLVCFSCSATKFPIEFKVYSKDLERKCIEAIKLCNSNQMRIYHQEIKIALNKAADLFEKTKTKIRKMK